MIDKIINIFTKPAIELSTIDQLIIWIVIMIAVIIIIIIISFCYLFIENIKEGRKNEKR